MTDALSHADVARFHMERRDNPMTITAILWLDGSLSLDDFDALVDERLLTRSRFRERVVEHTLAGPRWEPDASFDLRAHVHHVALPAPGDDRALEELVADLASTPLDPRIPLWQAHLIDGVASGCALVVRVHHVMADGLALVELLLGLTDEGPDGWTPPSIPALERRGLLASLAPLVGLAGLVMSRPDPSTALVAQHGAHKHLAWSRGLDLATLKRVASESKTGVTALLLALVTASLRGVLLARQELAAGFVVRAMVPLSVRVPSESAAMGNRYASVFVGLPVGVSDARARVAEVARRLKHVRVAGGLTLGRSLVSVASRVGAPIESLGVQLLSRRASLVVSNVPGPHERRHVAGRALRAVAAFAPVTGEIGLGVTFLGYADTVSVGVSSGLDDASLPREIVDGLHRELDALRDGARWGG